MYAIITIHLLSVNVHPQFHQCMGLPNWAGGLVSVFDIEIPTLKITGNKEARIPRCHFLHVVKHGFSIESQKSARNALWRWLPNVPLLILLSYWNL